MEKNEAEFRMRTTALTQKFIEIGKVLLTHNALSHSPENVVRISANVFIDSNLLLNK